MTDVGDRRRSGCAGRRREGRSVERLRMALTRRLRRTRADLRNHRRARPATRARAGRQDDQPARRAAHRRPPAARQGAPHTPRHRPRRLRALALRPSGDRPRPRRNRQHHSTGSLRWRAESSTSGFFIVAVRILTGSKGSSSTPTTASTRRLRLARRHLDRRRRRPDRDRRRALSGLPRNHEASSSTTQRPSR